MRASRLLTGVLLLLVFSGPPAVRADEGAARAPLTLRDLYDGGRRFTKSIPDWRWRPGHAQLVRVERRSAKAESGASGKPIRRPPRRLLVAMDPESGKVSDLLDLTALDALVPGKGTRMAGIGRAAPPSFRWSQDGDALCVVVKGDLIWVDLETGFRRRLTQTDSPMADLNIAPDGRYVSFAKANELWVVATKEGEPYALTSDGSDTLLNATLDWLYPEELGFRTAAWWSPDGKHLAYLQMDQSQVPRYRVPQILPLRSEGREMFYPKAGDPNPKVRVGVVPAAGGKTVWVELGRPAPEYVARVGWVERSPGAAPSLLVVTLDRSQQHLRIHVGDPSAGAQTSVWREERSEGWFPPPPRIRCVEPNRFLWRSVAEGTPRWGLADLSDVDHPLRWLTSRRVVPRDLIYYHSNERWCLYDAIHLEDGSQEILRGGLGAFSGRVQPIDVDWPRCRWTGARVDDTGRYVLATTSDAVTPPRVSVLPLSEGRIERESDRTAPGERVLGDSRTAALDTVALALPQYGALPRGDHGEIRWRLWKPADFDPKKRYGLIVHTYGGPGSRMVQDTWGRGPLLTTLLCQRGFLVLEADGRGTSGQGEAWMHSVQGKLGVLEVEDQATAVQAILERGYVDPERVGIWGWSYGGTMACNALTMRGDVFKAGVAVAPVTDWRLYDSIYSERYMGLPKDNPKGYEESSAITHAKKLAGHLLLLHGLGDDNVHAQNTLRLVEAFIQAKKTTYETMLYPKRGHGLGGAHLDVFTRLVDFFERHIGQR